MASFDFVVEDGSGIIGANSYIDLDYFYEWAAFYEVPELENMDEVVFERYARRASSWFDQQLQWKSQPLVEGQGLEFPRVPFKSRNGGVVSGIPDEIKNAIVIIIQAINDGVDLYQQAKVLSAQTYGNSSETYFGAYVQEGGTTSALTEAMSEVRKYGLGSKGFRQIPIVRG